MKIKLMIAAISMFATSLVFAGQYVDDTVWVTDGAEVVTLVNDPQKTQILEVELQGENGTNATRDGVVVKGCLEGSMEIRYVTEKIKCTVYKGYSKIVTIQNFGETTHAYGVYHLSDSNLNFAQ